jgi:hypothetical protein
MLIKGQKFVGLRNFNGSFESLEGILRGDKEDPF